MNNFKKIIIKIYLLKIKRWVSSLQTIVAVLGYWHSMPISPKESPAWSSLTIYKS